MAVAGQMETQRQREQVAVSELTILTVARRGILDFGKDVPRQKNARRSAKLIRITQPDAKRMLKAV